MHLGYWKPDTAQKKPKLEEAFAITEIDISINLHK